MSLPRRPALLLPLLLLATPALAENGVLQLPRPGAAGDSQTSAPATPKAAPVTPVQHAGPAPKAKAKAKPTPVVQAPANAHAQHPAGAAAPAAAAAPTPPAPPAAAVKPEKPADDKGTVTGLPLPRWAALRSDEVNLRVGPGTRFPIEWQYHRRDLPVEILREVEVWRLVEDQDGIKGWVHQATLVGHRSFVVKGAEAVLRRAPDEAAAAVARLKPGVVGRLRACAAHAAWCEVQVGQYRGYLRREQFWGTFPDEAVNN
jgi:SH3-like domain-containing protein